MGSTALEPGVVGTVLKMRPKPSPSHSVVTPTQRPALLQVLHPDPGAAGQWGCSFGPRLPGLLVSSPISGNPVAVQFCSPLSV